MTENVSTIFLLPGIEIREELKAEFYSQGFINTFLHVKGLNYPYPVIYLLFKPTRIDHSFVRFANELQKNGNFLETIDAGRNKVLMVYRVPKRFRRDYDLFLEGKYSRLSDSYKRCFQMEQFKLDALGRPMRDNRGRWIKEPTDFYHVFNRTDDIKKRWLAAIGYDESSDILDDVELYEKQDTQKETYEPDEEALWLE